MLIFEANDMGKKGGKKKHNVDKAAENAEPNLSTIPEEINPEQEKPGDFKQPKEKCFSETKFPHQKVQTSSNQLKEQKYPH